ncbi:protein kinase domain-containing protein [Nannocystaceae bacterium ST9]
MTGPAASTEPAGELDETPWPAPDFEQRRAIDAVRGKLFGRRVEVHIGRYRVDRRLGAGGMGEVYLAFDEALDRKVAIKRVRGDRSTAAIHARLREEARALARLSHANVVQIYEVGEHEGQTFLAMEFVEGTTLAGWLMQPKSWRAILDVFLAAGRGLAAAHSAGVVHRDFKPDNVLIGSDGRVCVADFGLALAGEAREPGPLQQSREVAGTIRYMSLEQLRGDSVDACSDQFAFCTALCEALWDQPPFHRGNAIRRMIELAADRPEQPRRRGVPRALWPIVRRGLRRDPARRWPDVATLLAALEAVPRRRAQRAWALASGPVLLIGGLALARLTGAPVDACAAVPEELAGAWDESIERELSDAFVATGVEHAAASAERVSLGLDAWSREWTDERVAQCRAADEGELARARRVCLERQRRSVEILTTVLRDPDVGAVDRAVEAVAELPSPSECSAAELLEGPALASEAKAPRVEALRLALAEARALRQLGRADPQLAGSLVDRAGSLDYLPVLAEAAAEQGRTEIEGGDPRVGLDRLDEAARLAIAANHPRLLAETWTALALFAVSEFPDYSRGGEWLVLAEAAWARLGSTELGPSDRERSQFAFARGRLALAERRRDQALGFHREAIELHGDRDSVILPGLLLGLAELTDPSEAIELDQRALAVAERVFGPSHPRTAAVLYSLGVALEARGELERAAPLFERAVAIWTQAHGDPHPDLARAHLLLADRSLQAGDLDDAERHALALASIQAGSLPADHPDLGDAPMLLGRIAGLRGDRALALRYAREALAHWQRSAGPSAPHVLEMRLDIASSELGLGEFAAAELEYRTVLAASDDPAIAGVAGLGLAELALRQGQLQLARERLAAVEAIGIEALVHHRITHVVLRFLIESRAGCRDCGEGLAARVDAVMREGEWTDEMVQPWLLELAVTPAEAAQLGLTIDALASR